MQTRQTPQDVPLFGAEGLRQIERVNAEIDRNSRACLKPEPAMPLFTDDQDEETRR